MDHLTRMNVVQRYLTLTDSIIHEASEKEMSVTFSEEADRVLTRRPFYWAFVDRTGTPPQTMSYVLHVQQPVAKEFPTLHLGYPSPFFVDMIHDINNKGKWIQCFEVIPPGGIPQFETWLHCTICIRCFGASSNRLTFDLGISLASGAIIADFLSWLGTRPVQAHYPPTFHNPTSLSILQARVHLQAFIGEKLSALNMSWAVEAYDTYLRECAIADGDARRISECEIQLRPRIEVAICGAGLFHLLRQTRHA